jgi:hypothetical protein
LKGSFILKFINSFIFCMSEIIFNDDEIIGTFLNLKSSQKVSKLIFNEFKLQVKGLFIKTFFR